jgi:hypothetical protein
VCVCSLHYKVHYNVYTCRARVTTGLYLYVSRTLFFNCRTVAWGDDVASNNKT